MEHNIKETDLPILLLIEYQFETARKRPLVYIYSPQLSCNQTAKFNNFLTDPKPIANFL